MISATTYLTVVIGGGLLGYWTPEIIRKIRRKPKITRRVLIDRSRSP